MSRREAGLSGRVTVYLDHHDRARLLDELEGMVAHHQTVEEHLTVAAYRSGTTLSAWTESRLDTIRQAVSELREKVAAAPVRAD